MSSSKWIDNPRTRNMELETVDGFASCDSVDHYEYIDQIGQGTYGVVCTSFFFVTFIHSYIHVHAYFLLLQ